MTHKSNGKAARADRKAAAQARLAASKPCTTEGCKSVHVDGHK